MFFNKAKHFFKGIYHANLYARQNDLRNRLGK